MSREPAFPRAAAPARPRERALVRLLARTDRLINAGARASLRLSRWRLAIVLTGALAAVSLYKLAWYQAGDATLAAAALIFLAVARYHSRVEARLHRMRRWRDLKRAHLARLRLDWDALPAESVPSPPGHPYAADLDLTGRASLLRLLDTTFTTLGRERLAARLLDQSVTRLDQETWRERQGLARELAGRPLLRDRLVLAAQPRAGQTGSINGGRLLALLRPEEREPDLRPLLVLQSLLAACTVALGLGSLLALLPAYWMISFGLYATIAMLSPGGTTHAFDRAQTLHLELRRLVAVFRCLERRSYTASPALGRLCLPLIGGVHRPSRRLARLARLCHALSVRAHPLIHLGLNALLPWDLWFAHRLARLRAQIAGEAPGWLDRLAELEAAASLGTLAWLNPDSRWPARLPDAGEGRPPVLTARALGHPLIPQARRVANDLELRGAGRLLLVTGSNMSGKSTFLRTVGLNVCLAQAGGPVCAEAFEWTWARPFCCIRVDDSLEAGLSYFYAEVKRLRRILDEAGARDAAPVLFLIDEIFKGTNNRERLIGSGAFLRALAARNGFGLVTTHDLELTEIERDVPGAANAHFQEFVENGSLAFDYRLRPGPCPTTNALRIMALEGLPVPQPGPDPPRRS